MDEVNGATKFSIPLPCGGLLPTGSETRAIRCRRGRRGQFFLLAGAGFAPAVLSTPKSQTYRFIPSGRISARAYSPGGSGSLIVNRKTVGAISHRWIEIVFRFSSNCSPKRLLIDSSCLRSEERRVGKECGSRWARYE